MSDAAPQLIRAYELVESGDREAALQLLNSIQSEFEADPDYWWIYAHAVDDAAEGQAALQRVAALKPDYPGISNLTQQVLRTQQEGDSAPVSAQSSNTDETTETTDFDFDDGPAAAVETSRGRNRLWIGLGLVALLLLVGLLTINRLNQIGAAATGTPVAQATDSDQSILPVTPLAATDAEVTVPAEAETEAVMLTDEGVGTIDAETTMAPDATDSASEVTPADAEEGNPEATADVTEPDQPAAEDTPEVDITEVDDAAGEMTPDATESASTPPADDETVATELVDLLADFELADEAITTQETTLGETLVVNFCAAPGPGASATMGDIGAVVADVVDELDETITAVGFGLTNCESGRLLRIIGVPRSVVQEYGIGAVSFNEFQSLLRPIG